VQKGAGSEARVVSHVERFLPHVEALNAVQKDIREHVNRELQNLAVLVFGEFETSEARRAVFTRAARRRVAAMMDDPIADPIASWEQYLYPPAGSDLLAGDVIRRTAGNEKDEKDYRIVLTPSCDLVSKWGRHPKVEKVLVASCTSVSAILADIDAHPTTKPSRLKEKIKSFLTRGFGQSCLVLPELPGVLPAMTANLKTLELIEISRIGNDGKSEYCRVVSVDSPFREMITWAYVQVTGRPGLPRRDFDAWADKLCSIVAAQGDRGGD
jgi:hypothetical protein